MSSAFVDTIKIGAIIKLLLCMNVTKKEFPGDMKS